MTVQEIRIKCLMLANPNLTSPDVEMWVDRARKLEAYVTANEGQGNTPLAKRPRGRPPKVKPVGQSFTL